MKKIVFLFLLLMFPTLVFASTVDYDIKNFLVDAKIKENGDMQVKELIVLDGTFNGYIRDLTYANNKLKKNTPTNFEQDAIYNATDITDVKIKAKKVNGSITFDTMNETFTTLENSNATNEKYLITSLKNGFSYKMYFKSNNESVAFYLEYTVKNAIVLHQDIAELYWAFLGEDFDDDLRNVNIRVSLPGIDSEYRVWAHGDLTGEINKVNNQTVQATIEKLPKNSPLDIRLTFNKNLVNSSIYKTTNEKALESILKVEEKRAQEANEKREKAKKVRFLVNGLGILYLVILISWWIYVYLKYDKEYKTEFNLEYNREFIDDYNVEVIDYLMKEKITPNAMSASILNLVYKKNIKVEEIPNEKNKNYEFTLLNKENINDSETILIEFLFDTVGENGKFTSENLKKYAEATNSYKKFHTNAEKWYKSVRKNGEKEHFFESTSRAVVSGLFSFIFSFFYLFIAIFFGIVIIPFICFFCGVIFFVYSITMKKRSKKGAEHYQKWKAFKKFLEDFGNFEVKELPEIILWERYLVYATIFGIADKVEKAMNIKIKEMNELSYINYYPSWIDYSIANAINRSISDSFTRNSNAYSREIANSSLSSGSGRGGGFSSGGGFGGGGGGGRGF